MQEKIFRISEAVRERLERRDALQAVAREYYDVGVSLGVYEGEVAPDQCRLNQAGTVFSCSVNFQCLKGSSGVAEHSCVNGYVLCPTTPIQCVSQNNGETFQCLGTTIYECATFKCGSSGPTNHPFECTASTIFGCNGTGTYDCANKFKCTGGEPGFSCTSKHDCSNSHGCGTTPPSGDSFSCGVGSGSQDQYNCIANFDCNAGTQGNNPGGFQCAPSARFDCGKSESSGTSGSFDCKANFECGKSGGFGCKNGYECRGQVNCVAPFNPDR